MSAAVDAVETAEVRYLRVVEETLRAAVELNLEAVAEAAALVSAAFARDGQLFVFGSGHSHVFAEEAFYRAGGAARVCPVLVPRHMLHEGAVLSTRLERERGHGAAVLEGYDLVGGRDVLLVVSNSGTNALPLEVATIARERGVDLIAITSIAYAESKPGPRLHEIADVVLDNLCPPGDAFIEIAPGLPRVGPGSSVVGLALLNAVVVGALASQVSAGVEPEIYLSAGMPDALRHNAELAERLAPRNPHL